MHTDNDGFEPGIDGVMEAGDEASEKNLRWLLDMDLSEPEEKLFTVSGTEYLDEGLTAYEAEVAGRPLVRGNASSDDFASYVDEEIVISSDDQRSDIYTDTTQEMEQTEEEEFVAGEAMALDYSRKDLAGPLAPEALVTDGSDILELEEQDDMGERFLSIKRVKADTINVSPEPLIATRVVQEEDVVEELPVQVALEIPQTQPMDAVAADGACAGDIEASQESVDDCSLQEQPDDDLHSCLLEDEAEDHNVLQAGGGEAVVGDGEQQPEHAVIDWDPAAAVNLREAPVPSLVAQPGSYDVANEGPLQDDSHANADDVAASVLDYVARMELPVDDEEFDQYLLGGEDLLDINPDPNELAVQRTEGIVSVDPSLDIAIDYHEDFRAMDGFERASVSAITSVISPVMEEIAHRARGRMEELGYTADAIEVDVMLGSDPDSIKRCYADGFEPVTSVCIEIPSALQGLASSERDAIYVRLFHGQTNELWNDLFSDEFVSPGQSFAGEPTAEFAQGEFDADEPAGDSSTGFDEASLELGLDDEFAGAVDAIATMDEAADIDALFDDLMGEEPDPGAGDDLSVSPDFAALDEGELNVGFGEDIFADDFSVEFPVEGAAAGADINAVFPGVTPTDSGFDVICGVDADEFGDSERLEESVSVHSREDCADAVDALQSESGLAWFIPQGIPFNHTAPKGAEIFTDFLDAFIEEGSAEVEKLEDAFGEWEKDATVELAFAPIARTLHTVKGIAKGVGLQRYGTLVHNFETLLEARPCPEPGDEQDYFRMVNIWLDAVVRGIEFVREQRTDIASEFPVHGLSQTEEPAAEESLAVHGPAATEELSSAPAPSVEPLEAVAARHKKRDKQLADEGAKALAAQQSVRITSEKLDHLLNLTSQAQQLGVRSSQGTSRGKRASVELQSRLSSVRTHIAKIADRALLSVNTRGGRSTPDMDALEMDQYSELQEAASILREGVEDLADLVEMASRQNTLVEALLKQQSSVISSITSSIQAARVVPVSRLMPGLRRLVRTVSTDLDKAVSFKVLNEVGALDRDHYSRCQVILEHMVRNALDHGIETPEERLALGKPTAGRITIDVRKSGGDYMIKLADDGKGIDPEAIRESAYEKGLDIDVDALSDEEAIRLIFHKGFSTASTLSEISGRGVGMDIVMSELQQLGGDVQIQSAVGLGTSFELRIPSNVSVNGALFVNAGESSYAIPLNGLIAVEHVAVEEFYGAVERGKTLSLFDMDCEPAYLATLCQGESLPDQSVWGATVPVIIAGSDQRHMAIAIDSVEEALELVVRSLGAQFSSVPGLAGAATTADGEAIVALDLNLLVASVVSGALAPVAVSREADSTLLALVVDDSRTQRMVATSQLDTVGVETITAENGMVAIDLLNATHRLPDIVLLDVEMPVKDGIETLREIRKSLRYGHLPVIMVTSRTGAKHRAMAREAGCNGYMGKPFNFPGLVEQISELTGHDLQLS